MFDGNHRSRRRSQRLGRRNKARPSENKADILARTTALRQERHAAQLRENSARCIQRVLRSYVSRQGVVHEWVTWLQQSQSSATTSDTTSYTQSSSTQSSSTVARHTLVLNYVLGRSDCLVPSSLKRTLLIAFYEQRLATLQSATSSSLSSTSSPSLLPPHQWIHHLTKSTLQLLTTTNSNDTVLLQLWHVLPTFVGGHAASTTRFLGQDGLILLAQTCVATRSDVLYQTLTEIATYNNNNNDPNNNHNSAAYALQAAVGWSLGKLSDPMSLQVVVDLLSTQEASSSSSSSMLSNNALRTAVHQFINIPMLIQQGLPHVQVLPLVVQLWTLSSETTALWNLTRSLVSGQSDITTASTTTAAAASNQPGSTSSDSEDNEEDEEANRNPQPMDIDAASTRGTATARRITAAQISTLPQLDRLAKLPPMSSVTNNNTTTNNQSTLAQRLADPNLWLVWGKTCLTVSSSSSSSAYAAYYIRALALILPTRLHARTTARSTLLTKLAFDAGLGQALWSYAAARATQEPPDWAALTVWSNVLAQTLLVIKDDEFLARYAQPQGTVRAVDMIAVLRQALYRVYWTVPVQVDDVKASFQPNVPPVDYAAHFLLAGTKLYNALYQRWCRLVRSPNSFASEESIWWFPSLSVTSTRVHLEGPAAAMESESDGSDDDNDAMDVSPADAESQALAAAFDDPKLSRVLTSIPQALPFEKRVKLFDSLVKADKAKTQDASSVTQNIVEAMMRGDEAFDDGRQRVEIRREYLYQDAMHQLNQLGPKLRRKIQVSFVNQHGAAEAGIDGGGVFKEFLDDLVKDAFSLEESSSSTLSLFSVTPLETLAVNLDYANRPDLLAHYEFLGRAIGKAVYEGILVDPQFCLPFLNQLLGKANSLEDLKNYDPEYYKNLTKLLTMNSADFETLGLTFEVSVGKSGRTVDLKLGGSQIPVTPQNVIPYAHLVAHQLLNVQSDKAVKAFLRGFRDLIPAPWVRLFAAHELQKIISGDDSRLDVASFKATMQYAAGYHPSQPIVQWFWEIVENDLTPEQQCKLLKFMTSCSRQPLLGFNSLEPAPCVQQIRLPDSLFLQEPADILKKAPLPTASTCMNLLKLPNYRSKELMRVKLIAAIEAGAGFELT